MSEYQLNPIASAGRLINPAFTSGKINAGLVAGDLNGDCRVNAADVLLVMRIITHQIAPTPRQQQAADVAPIFNGVALPNEQIDSGDLLAIQRKALGQIDFDFVN